MAVRVSPLCIALGVVVASLAVVGCGDRPAMETNAEADDSDTVACKGAALEYHGVCFYARSLAGIRNWGRPLELDGQPGHELVSVSGGVLSVHRFEDDRFVLVGEATLPDAVGGGEETVLAGEFDDSPGLDLVVIKEGKWAALIHLEPSGAPIFVGATFFPEPLGTSHVLEDPVAVGPDADGRWRIVAHYDDGEALPGPQPLALWELQDGTFVGQRLELPTTACSLEHCAAGDFDGDGRQDAVCELANWCVSEPDDSDIEYVLLLAQADGTVVATSAVPMQAEGGAFAADLDADGITDLVGPHWHRLGDGAGLGALVHGLALPPADFHWWVISVGDLDRDGDVELVLGEDGQGLVFEDRVGEPSSYERLELPPGLNFSPYNYFAMDVNGDGVIDLPVYRPMSDTLLLVSEVRP